MSNSKEITPKWAGLIYQGVDYYPKYSVSEYGDVVNNFTGTILKQTTNRGGYRTVCISCPNTEKKRKTIIIHKAVAYNFLDPPVQENMVIDHIDANKKNNHYSNLEWVTSAENTNRAYKKGLFNTSNRKNRKLTRAHVLEIKAILHENTNRISRADIAKKFGVSRSTIWLIATGKMHNTITGL